MDYNQLQDNEILTLVQQKDDEAMEYMIKKYGPLVKREVRTFYLIGAETEDLYQEGMIGLFKAVRDYSFDKGGGFAGFATMCIRRQIQNAITNSNRKKHGPLNTYVSLYGTGEDTEQLRLENMVASSSQENPETLVLDKERQHTIQDLINQYLSKMEKQVLDLYLQGLSYDEIADSLGKTRKAVDNALQRIRGKMSKVSV